MISGSRRLSLVTVVSATDLLFKEDKQYKKLNNYLLVKKIGSGSFSKVYLGVDTENFNKKSYWNNNLLYNGGNGVYAIKRISIRDLSRTTNGVMQLEREIRLLRYFNHENILKLHEVLHSKADNMVYLVLEYADCGSIGAILENRKPQKRPGYKGFSIESIRSIMKQITSALSYIHSMGYVHQDIKPGNILLKSNGKVLLADFGIGHSFMSSAMVVGTPAFQAPEALNDIDVSDTMDDLEDGKGTTDGDDEEDHHSLIDSTDEDCPQVREDIWALGVTLYQLIFNELPYVGANLYEIVSNIKSSPLSFPREIDSQISELIQGMLSVDPEKRLTLDDILKNPFVKDAKDFIECPNIIFDWESDYEDAMNNFVQIDAIKCMKDYSFAQAALSVQNKLESMNSPYSSTRMSLPHMVRRNSDIPSSPIASCQKILNSPFSNGTNCETQQTHNVSRNVTHILSNELKNGLYKFPSFKADCASQLV